MFQTHGGLFILKAVKIHLEAGGQRNLLGGRGKEEMDAPTHTARASCVMSEKWLGGVPVYLAGGSGVVSSHSDTPNKSRLTSGHQGLHLCCRFQTSETLIFKTHRQVEPIKKDWCFPINGALVSFCSIKLCWTRKSADPKPKHFCFNTCAVILPVCDKYIKGSSLWQDHTPLIT